MKYLTYNNKNLFIDFSEKDYKEVIRIYEKFFKKNRADEARNIRENIYVFPLNLTQAKIGHLKKLVEYKAVNKLDRLNIVIYTLGDEDTKMYIRALLSKYGPRYKQQYKLDGGKCFIINPQYINDISISITKYKYVLSINETKRRRITNESRQLLFYENEFYNVSVKDIARSAYTTSMRNFRLHKKSSVKDCFDFHHINQDILDLREEDYK